MYSVTIRQHFMIAHSLDDPYFGPAQGLHGATYIVDVTFRSNTLNEHQVVIDIGAAHDALGEVLDPLDYKNLDELEEFEEQLTTTEFLAHYIFDKLCVLIRDEFKGTLKVRLGESHEAWASYEGEVL